MMRRMAGEDTTAGGDDPRAAGHARPGAASRCGASSRASCARRSARGACGPACALPASRALAAQLGVSRGVVTDAYEQLDRRGLARGPPRRRAPSSPPRRPSPPPPPEPPRRAAVRFDFTPTTPDVSLFPRRTWARAIARALRRGPDAELDYGSGLGSRRAARGARGLPRARPRDRRRAGRDRRLRRLQPGDPAAVFGVLAERGVRRVGLEDPSLTDHWDAARDAGLEPVPIPLDGEGLRVDALAASGAGASPSSRRATSSRRAR